MVIPISKYCLLIYERFKRHILCSELDIVEEYNVLEMGFSKRLGAKATITP